MPKCFYAVSDVNRKIVTPTTEFAAGTHPVIEEFVVKNNKVAVGLQPTSSETTAQFAVRLQDEINARLQAISGVNSVDSVTVTHQTNGAAEEFTINTGNAQGDGVLEMTCNFASNGQAGNTITAGYSNLGLGYFVQESSAKKKTIAYNYMYMEGIGNDCQTSTALGCPATYSTAVKKRGVN